MAYFAMLDKCNTFQLRAELASAWRIAKDRIQPIGSNRPNLNVVFGLLTNIIHLLFTIGWDPHCFANGTITMVPSCIFLRLVFLKCMSFLLCKTPYL